MKKSWVVHKFGGTSVAGSDRYRQVTEIMKAEPGARKAIVVSAMSKVTDALIELADLACKRDPACSEKLKALRERHYKAASELLPEGARDSVMKAIDADFADLADVLKGIGLVRTCADRTLDLVSGYGEIWSAQLLNAYIGTQGIGCDWLDARKVLVVDPSTTPVSVRWPDSEAKIAEWLSTYRDDWVVVTGFVASTEEGIPTTLKRNGSDYSGSIFGALLVADCISIWTDVDGVLSADPRLVPDAVVLERLSYQEATELAYFGAKVVHPATMAPAIERRIPIMIRNTFNLAAPGTRIWTESSTTQPVCGFATVDRVALVNVEGTGMIGVPGVAQRLFATLKEIGVSVIMVSQASSEHSICVAIPSAQAASAKAAIERAFYAELHHGQIEKVEVTDECTILAAVGDGMAETPGVSGKFLTALGRAGINVRAIAQGSSERNISAVVSQAEATRAVRAAHSGFFLSSTTISVGVIGTGVVGSAFFKVLHEAAAKLRSQGLIDLRLRAIADSKRMALGDRRLEAADKPAASALLDTGKPLDLDAFAAHVRAEHIPHAVIIDCTASQEIASRYLGWINAGLHVITPNKKACAGDLAYYQAVKAATQSTQRRFLYQGTVGAGLPILNTLRDLVRTGDRVLEFEGVLSGTLSYIFNSITGGAKMADAVREARAKGFTEPDPRDDLSGTDVARKVVILAREMGLTISLSDVTVRSLVPDSLKECTVDEFMGRLGELDEGLAAELIRARADNHQLRYVGQIDVDGKATVGLKSYAFDHPFSQLKFSDNVVAFRTERYSRLPLIIQGAGAGPEVTAGGVLADLLRLCSFLGAPL